MFRDDLPPGTEVETNTNAPDERFRQIVPSRSRGVLGNRLTGSRESSGPDDLFEVTINGIIYHIRRKYLDQTD
jgi:hypothetical protein